MLKVTGFSFPSCFGDLCPILGGIVPSGVLGMLLRGAGELTKGVIYRKSPLQMAQPQSPGWHLQQEWHPSLLDASLSPLCVRAAETCLQASKLACSPAVFGSLDHIG